jgi:aminoglycoside phosphotransferase (APT) family kinase protein
MMASCESEISSKLLFIMTPETLAFLLEPHFPNSSILKLQLLAGGASKEAWLLDLEQDGQTLELIMRRAGGGAMNLEQLSLEQEFRVLAAAFSAGVTVPKPILYLPDVLGREAFISQRIRGEAVGRRIVSRPEFSVARLKLPKRMADELAKIHAVNPSSLEFLPNSGSSTGAQRSIARLYAELNSVNEPHPTIELALHWLKTHEPTCHGETLVHGDFRIGNLMLSETDLVAVLDWEFAHLGDPAEDLAWTLIRAWRFGQDHLHLGGIGELEPYLTHYNQLTKQNITIKTLLYWEIMGNVKWAVAALTQAKRHLDGFERSVELAVLGRLSAEMELEIIHLLEETTDATTSQQS